MSENGQFWPKVQNCPLPLFRGFYVQQVVSMVSGSGMPDCTGFSGPACLSVTFSQKA